MHSKSVASVNSQECEVARSPYVQPQNLLLHFQASSAHWEFLFMCLSLSKEFTTEMTSVLLAIFCAICLQANKKLI